MFVVHALWQRDPERGSGRLALWAEDSSLELPARRPGRAPKVQVHPFAATHDDLAELGLTGGKPTTATVTLPARGGRPLDSPHLIRNEPTAISGVTAARRWQVPVVEFDADLAADILAGLDPDRAAPATSFSHLLELSRFAYDLVGRGRLLPRVDADGPRATWRPVLTGPDAAWARSLAACLPPGVGRRRAGPAPARLGRRAGQPGRRRRPGGAGADPAVGRTNRLGAGPRRPPAPGWPP